MSLSINIQIPDEALARIVRKVVQEYLDVPRIPEPVKPPLNRPLSVLAHSCPTCHRELNQEGSEKCPDPWHTMGSGVPLVTQTSEGMKVTPEGLAYARQMADLEFGKEPKGAKGSVVLPNGHGEMLSEELQVYAERLLDQWSNREEGVSVEYANGARTMARALAAYVTGERL